MDMDTNNDFCSQSTTFNNISWPKQGAKTQFCFRRQIKCPADKVTGSTLVIKTVQMQRSDVVKQNQEKRALFSKNLIHLNAGLLWFPEERSEFRHMRWIYGISSYRRLFLVTISEP